MEATPIIIILILAAAIAFSYKVYLQDKLSGEPNSFAILGLFRRIFGIKYVFPINKANYPLKQYSLVRKGNLALVIFWICFVLVIILSAVEAYIKSA